MGNLEGIGEAVARERNSRRERDDVGFIFEVGVLEDKVEDESRRRKLDGYEELRVCNSRTRRSKQRAKKSAILVSCTQSTAWQQLWRPFFSPGSLSLTKGY